MKIFNYVPKKWSKATCKAIARRRTRDSGGAFLPLLGLVEADERSNPYGLNIETRLIRGVKYDGYHRPLPMVHKDYEFKWSTSYGWQLVSNVPIQLRLI